MEEVDNWLAQKAEEYLRLLVDAGMSRQSALDHTLEYTVSYTNTVIDWQKGHLAAAKALKQATRAVYVN